MEKIKCPYCEYEYLPSEIFIPKYFLGNAKNVIRHNKKIIDFIGQDMDMEEYYICDNCNKEFSIVGDV